MSHQGMVSSAAMRATVLVTGSTGCVGRALAPVVDGHGFAVRRGTRRPVDAREVYFDLDDERSLRPAVAGCHAAVYLVHGLARGAGYGAWEERAARAFAEACAEEGVRRVVYLGGVMPKGSVSPHLAARARTGAVLREVLGDSVVVELRAGMIVAPGSASFTLARDLAARAPALVRPPWLRSRQAPVAFTDVCAAIVAALDGERIAGGVYGCPGPDVLGGDETLAMLAELMGLRSRFIDVPALPHALAARALRRVTRADASVVHELVFGMTGDLLGDDPSVFNLLPTHRRTSFRVAAARALRAEERDVPWRAWLLEQAAQVLGGRR